MRKSALAATVALLLAAAGRFGPAHAAPVEIVAAENFYGDVAAQIGGPEVQVTSILSNPDVDPHLFEVSPAVGRAVAKARIVIESGIGYDPWLTNLLRANPAAGRATIVVAALIGRKDGDNPHIWYDPRTMLALAERLEATLATDDPRHAGDYAERLAAFRASIAAVEARIHELHARLAGTVATATEPVFGYMFAALGMVVRNHAFQLAVMNNTEPSAASIARFEADLREHNVALLVYNSQASDPTAARMEAIAKEAHVPIVGANETEPPGVSYQRWMLSELDAVAHALPQREE